jgi:4-aminobutyrate aminotransferase-like enzyme
MNSADSMRADSSGAELGTLRPHLLCLPPGPRSIAAANRLTQVECPAFEARRGAREVQSGKAQSPIVYARAHGDNLEDVDGNVYVDLTAGFGSLVLGHTPDVLTKVLSEQMATLPLALGDVYASECKVHATEAVAALFPEPGARVLWGLSGADAVTAAMKTAHLATKRPGILAFDGGYHGLSMGPLAACGLSDAFRAPFADVLSPHVAFLPYPTEQSMHATLLEVRTRLQSRTFAGVLVEPTQGRGGCIAPPEAFLAELRTLCTHTGTLLIADEVWTGMGRSGKLLQSADARPDVVCLGKGLGAGYAVSACVGSEAAMAAWGAQGGATLHTATHFGNPLGARAALCAIEQIRARALCERAERVGERFRASLHGAGFEASGRGLMVGIRVPSALQVSRALLERGYIVLTGGKQAEFLTLSPALTVDEALLAEFVSVLTECV